MLSQVRMRTHPLLLRGSQVLRTWSLGTINYNRPHTYNENADDDAEKDQTDGVGIF